MIKRNWSDGKKLDKKYGGYHWLYMTKRWRLQRIQQLKRHPLCAACLQDNVVKAANTVHHSIDHGGDYKLFFTTPLQSLCKSCHDNIKSGSQVLGYQRGCDILGKPYKTNPILIDNNKRMPGGSIKL